MRFLYRAMEVRFRFIKKKVTLFLGYVKNNVARKAQIDFSLSQNE